MGISSRTPEGSPHRCLICGHEAWIEPSDNAAHEPDAPCPRCGGLLWFREESLSDIGLPPSKSDPLQRWLAEWRATPLLSMSASRIALYERLVAALVEHSQAIGGAIWLQNRKSFETHFMAQINRDWLRDNGLLGDSHQQLLRSVSRQREVIVVPPLASRSSGREGENPSQFLLFCRHFQRRPRRLQEYGTFDYVLEVFQWPDVSEQDLERHRTTFDLLTRLCIE